LTAASPDPITQGNPNYDESHYINVGYPISQFCAWILVTDVLVQALAPVLRSNGWQAQFIVDQGRSGVQNLRTAWGDWCNLKGAGFGMRPTTSTGSAYIDAIVWAKPGGECDGTSDTSVRSLPSYRHVE
jgi:cellulose 1,4-beta-cellobiosidase